MGRCAAALREHGIVAHMIAGYAQAEFLTPLVERSGIADVFQPLYVRNDFFGGNVDVTGLLVGRDMTNAIKLNADTTTACSESELHASASDSAGTVPEYSSRLGEDKRADTCGSLSEHACRLYLIPRVVFNDDGITLDDMTLEDMEKAAGQTLHMVSCSPAEYFEEIATLLN